MITYEKRDDKIIEVKEIEIQEVEIEKESKLAELNVQLANAQKTVDQIKAQILALEKLK